MMHEARFEECLSMAILYADCEKTYIMMHGFGMQR